MVIIEAPGFVFIMYNTEDLCCVLPEGCYRLWIKNKAVVVRPDRHCVETDRHAEPTWFYFKKFESGGVCTYVIYVKGTTDYAEFDDKRCIFVKNGGVPRHWTVKPAAGRPDTFTIAPGPPSPNVWTAPELCGQICLKPLDHIPLPCQWFTFTKG